MGTTEKFTISLDSGAAAYVRRRVEEGHFDSPTEYFEDLLVSDMLEPVDQEALVHWMNTEGARRLQALRDEPSKGLSLEEAFAGLDDEQE